MKNIFIPDNETNISQKGSFLYKLNTLGYQTVLWTPKQKLLYKISTLSICEWEIEKDLLSIEEKSEYKKLFDGINKTPSESVLKKCLLVIYFQFRSIGKGVAIGLEIINGNNYVVFKSGNVDEVKTICRKNGVTLNYDRKFVLSLLNNAYLNEIIQEEMWGYTARKYIKIKNRNKSFENKLKQFFSLR
jgi:hypothetical protein